LFIFGAYKSFSFIAPRLVFKEGKVRIQCITALNAINQRYHLNHLTSWVEMLCLGLYEISFNEFIIVIISITIIHFFINHLFKKD